VRIAVLLRVSVTLNRSRDPQPLPPFQLTAAGSTLELRLPDGWLGSRPLTRADLENEKTLLEAAGVAFRFE
jgi:exopolyphosphatase/guanosine-5'-triphosphate,3'-diphosphate pyrophosphatase